MNTLKDLSNYGQSVWLDYIRRSLMTGGELKRLIEEDGLKGVTSNPAIFEKAITGSSDYTTALETLAGEKGLNATIAPGAQLGACSAPEGRGPGTAHTKSLYERLAIEDIRQAAIIMEPVYVATQGRDGYVSLEVSPHLAHDIEGTCEEARRLWQEIGRQNVMIKVPVTPEGIPAIEQLIGEGINVNATLLFSIDVYERVALAYLRGLERLAERGGDVNKVASVASFFISRIDAAIDKIIVEQLANAQSAQERSLLQGILGKVAIANAKSAYQRYKQLFSGKRWQALEKMGARTQRLLWASTSTKNPEYRDVLYIEELIGPDTVNTIPPATYDAFREHGRLRPSLEEDLEAAQNIMDTLDRLGISMKAVTDRLLDQGVRLFADAFNKLLAAVEAATCTPSPEIAKRMTYSLPEELTTKVSAALEDWRVHGKVRRLWSRDAKLWTGADEGDWLGWLAITEDQHAHLDSLRAIAQEIKEGGFSHILLLGMGGSSLCPEVLMMTFGKIDGYPELHILDSTDPAQIKAVEAKIDLARTLFIVSSKSGSTLEPNIFKQYFFERVREALGPKAAGSRFIAITDPKSKLQHIAEGEGFRQIFLGLPSIGGRYSALSPFGVVPAAVMGVDVPKFLDRADEMVQACAACVPVEENPGVALGAILGVLGKSGRDKVTLVASPGIRDLGAWLEQLLAESTGKQGKALIPVDGERPGPPEVYGDDRIFVYLRLESAPDAEQDAAVARLEQAGQPVVRIAVANPYDLGQEFFSWEFATVVAGSILGINPFNQPDVEASKVATRELTSRYEATGSLPSESPLAQDDTISLLTDANNASALMESMSNGGAVSAYLKAHLSRLCAGDYFALLAYLERNDDNHEQLQAIRHAVRDAKRVATCLGYGPRFLHSTGQAYKGGPNTGVFLQITCDDAVDLPVPDQKYTFGVVKAAQAQGDFQILAERGRRVLRVHLGQDVIQGLGRLRELMTQALSDLEPTQRGREESVTCK